MAAQRETASLVVRYSAETQTLPEGMVAKRAGGIVILGAECNAHLADRIADRLRLTQPERDIVFDGHASRVWSDRSIRADLNVTTDDVEGRPVIVVAPGSSNWEPGGNQLGLEYMVEAARSLGPRKIVAVLPYHWQGRLDKPDRGTVYAVRKDAQALRDAGAARIFAIDHHNPRACGENGIEVIYPTQTFATYLREGNIPHLDLTNAFVVSPDNGSTDFKRASRLARALGKRVKVVDMGKKRISESQVERTRIVGFENVSVNDSTTAIIRDDIMSTGTTVKKAIDDLLEKHVRHFVVVITHNVLGEGFEERVFAIVEKVREAGGTLSYVTTDTISHSDDRMSRLGDIIGSENIHVVSVAGDIADAVLPTIGVRRKVSVA